MSYVNSQLRTTVYIHHDGEEPRVEVGYLPNSDSYELTIGNVRLFFDRKETLDYIREAIESGCQRLEVGS
jgi:hypothetical protein